MPYFLTCLDLKAQVFLNVTSYRLLTVSEVAEKRSASTFSSGSSSTRTWTLDPEDEGNMIHRQFGNMA
jgi:hypothetical protein